MELHKNTPAVRAFSGLDFYLLKAGFLSVLLTAGCFTYGQQLPYDRNRVMDYFQDQQFDEASSYLLPFYAADSSNPATAGLLGYAAYMNDKPALATRYYGRMFVLDSASITANFYLALLYNARTPERALHHTRILLHLQPSKALYQRNAAALFRRLGAKDSAFLYYGKAYALSPGDPVNAAGFADILLEHKNYVLADSILDIALARDSLNISCLKIRVRAANEAKQYEDAVVPGERLIRMQETSAGAVTQIIIAYYHLGRYTDCIRVGEYAQLNEIDAEALFYYEAKAMTKLKRYTESNELLQICLDEAIRQPAELYYYSLGENYEAMKRFSSAVSQYDTAFYLFKNPLMKYYAARVYENNLKNQRQARVYYRAYLSTARPETPDEKKAYEYIKKKYGYPAMPRTKN